MEYNHTNENTVNIAGCDEGILPSQIKARLDYMLDALACMDSRVEQELARVEQSSADEDLKEFIKQDILSRHAESRSPFVTALEDLRQHQPSQMS